MAIPAPPTQEATVAREAARRRTFAIISHPDAGKTTLTEKLLLYAGALAEAGAVKARRGRRAAASDWLRLEQERGISISSTVLRFSHGDTVLNLLDTPGHRDFSEDTYRVLAAADAAVMLLDAAKGIEPQTRRLFEVCRRRGLPILTFVNKYDRPGLAPLELIDHVERELGLEPVPLTWPVGHPGDFRGLVEPATRTLLRFERSPRGAHLAPGHRLAEADAAAAEGEAWQHAIDELSLVDAVHSNLDEELFAAGEQTPVLFGSAAWNFGVGLLLDALVERVPAPQPARGGDGELRALDAPFSGFVFKLQANMNPRHRDRLAFVRVCSGRFHRGMQATHARSGRTLKLNYAHELFADQRETIDSAYPGDIVGLVNASDLALGDTLFEPAGPPAAFPQIPTFVPERFAAVRNRDARRHKQFRRALGQLDQEGVVQVLTDPARGGQFPVLGAVGPLQFDVAAHRFEHEFGAPVELEPLELAAARRIPPEAAEIVQSWRHARLLVRADGQHLAAFPTGFSLERFTRDHPDILLDELI